jgi:DNA mismatch endonuclease Vsr
MAAIKGKNTKPELLVRSWLHRNGFRFRLHRKDLPGKPDIVLPKYWTVIFVHGCFELDPVSWTRGLRCSPAASQVLLERVG